MAVKKLSELTALTTAADGDLFLVNDVSEAADVDKPKKITATNLKAYTSADLTASLGLIDGLGFAPQFRLSLTSGNPTDTADKTSSGTVYYTPYGGNAIQLYNGTNWEVFALSELSLALTATVDKNYDIFIDYNAGTPQMILGSAWTDANTRADALAYQNGRLIKSGTAAYLYVGTIRADGTDTTIDSMAKRFVYNHYNKVYKPARAYLGTHVDGDQFVYWVSGDPNKTHIEWGYNSLATSRSDDSTHYGLADADLKRSLVTEGLADAWPTELQLVGNDNSDVIIYTNVSRVVIEDFSIGYSWAQVDVAVTTGLASLSYGMLYANLWM
jgi:hypothetical protein